MKTFIFLLFLGLSSAQTTTEPCEITGVCDINLDTLVEVSFYDVEDDYGCPLECEDLEICHFYSVFVDPYDENLNKCLLFESCNIIEECDECTTCK